MLFWQIVATTALAIIVLYAFAVLIVRGGDIESGGIKKKHLIEAAKGLVILAAIVAVIVGVIALFGLIWGGFS